MVRNESDGHWVDVGDIFSEDSSFVGDDTTKAELEGHLAAFNPKYYWDVVQWNVQCLAAQGTERRAQAARVKRPRSSSLSANSTPDTTADKELVQRSTPQSRPTFASDSTRVKLYNPLEGNSSAKQLSESLKDFLSRLTPSKTGIVSAGPWIWIANPHSPHRPTKEHIARLKQEGSQMLSEYCSRKIELEHKYPDKPQGSITRMLKPARDCLETQIVDLAKDCGVVCGKWMLFPSPEDVDRVWATVAKAVVENQLGCSAKVGTDDGDPNNKYRLVCIYTADFSNTTDVKRVLRKMRELKLVGHGQDRSRVIYYKCDAYTYLDIANGNEYKLKASMYNSKDLLTEMST